MAVIWCSACGGIIQSGGEAAGGKNCECSTPLKKEPVIHDYLNHALCNSTIQRLEKERNNALLQNSAMRRGLTDVMQFSSDDRSKAVAKGILEAHGGPDIECMVKRKCELPHVITQIEGGLRCSTSGCDDPAACNSCFGCKEHCAELKIEQSKFCDHRWADAEPGVSYSTRMKCRDCGLLRG